MGEGNRDHKLSCLEGKGPSIKKRVYWSQHPNLAQGQAVATADGTDGGSRGVG